MLITQHLISCRGADLTDGWELPVILSQILFQDVTIKEQVEVGAVKWFELWLGCVSRIKREKIFCGFYCELEIVW